MLHNVPRCGNGYILQNSFAVFVAEINAADRAVPALITAALRARRRNGRQIFRYMVGFLCCGNGFQLLGCVPVGKNLVTLRTLPVLLATVLRAGCLHGRVVYKIMFV